MSWETVPLGQVATLNPRPDSMTEHATFLGMAELGEDGRTSSGTRVEPADLKPGYTPFRNWDILVAKITPCFENGKIGQAIIGTKLGWGSTEFHVVRPHEELTDGRFLHHFLRTPRVRAFGEIRMTGSAGQRRVPLDFLRGLRVPLPPLSEQRRIAAILDEVDAIQLKQQAAIGSARELELSWFLDTVGDRTTARSRWVYAPIRDLGKVITGNTPPRSDNANYGGETEWIKSDNVRSDTLVVSQAAEYLSAQGRQKARFAPPGSILVTCIAGSLRSIGSAALVDREVAFNQQLNAFIPERLRPRFALALLRADPDQVREASNGGMQGLVSKSRFEAIELPVPPLSVQDAYVERAVAIDRHIARLQSSMDAAKALFASLQHRAFRGEL